MPTFEVVYEGTVREVYSVEAENEEEARNKWSDYESDYEPDSSEVMDGEVVEVSRV